MNKIFKRILHIFIILPFILIAAESAEKDSMKIPFNIMNRNILFVFRNHKFIIPVKDFTINKFLTCSVLYLPKDLVRDGLTWYGTKRDDWIDGKKVRKHLGVDIHYDSLVIVAAESGVVEIAGWNKISGKWIKIDHGDQIKTVYVHLSEMVVKKGMKVDQGQVIAKINKPEGNAIGTQLHFSLQIDGKKWDPLYFIKITYGESRDVMDLIEEYENNKARYEQMRDEKVRQFKLKKSVPNSL